MAGFFSLSPLNQRRWRNFKANRRAYWSLWIFLALYGLTLCAELIANNRPILVSYNGALHMPVFKFYPETAFGGDLRTEAKYSTVEVQCLILAAGSEACWDDPEAIIDEVRGSGTADGQPVTRGWMLGR